MSCNNLRVNESWVPNYRNWIHRFHRGNHFLHHISTLHQYTLHYHKYIHGSHHILESMSNFFRNIKYYYSNYENVNYFYQLQITWVFCLFGYKNAYVVITVTRWRINSSDEFTWTSKRFPTTYFIRFA